MIHDKIEHLMQYIPEEYKYPINQFLERVETASDGTYEIKGEEVYAEIMTYPTQYQKDCTIEAHDIYCDIQFTIQGEEGITIFPREKLKCLTIDREKDFATFSLSLEEPEKLNVESMTSSQNELSCMTVRNREGYFTLLHTYEAHRPQESVNGRCDEVKKAVIKIKEASFHEP